MRDQELGLIQSMALSPNFSSTLRMGPESTHKGEYGFVGSKSIEFNRIADLKKIENHQSTKIEDFKQVIAGRKTVGLDSAFSFAGHNSRTPFSNSHMSRQFGTQPTLYELRVIKSNAFHNVFINSVSVKEFAQLIKYALENGNQDTKR